MTKSGSFCPVVKLKFVVKEILICVPDTLLYGLHIEKRHVG